MGERVVVAMSGGLDSSVAAYLLKEQGFDVVGITLKLYPEVSRCCHLEDIEDARRVAHFLDIPHYVFDFTRDFNNILANVFSGIISLSALIVGLLTVILIIWAFFG